MPWVRFDDQFTIHRKVKGLSDAAYRLHTEGIFWCARNGVEFVGSADLRLITSLRKPLKHVALLVERELWIPWDNGWEIPRFDALHDFWSTERDDYRKKISPDVRRVVYERDGFRCVVCGSGDDLTLDHIYPWSLGGSDSETNLRTLCRSCNSSKGARV